MSAVACGYCGRTTHDVRDEICDTCASEENDRLYGPEDNDHDFCPQCGEDHCCEDTHGPR